MTDTSGPSLTEPFAYYDQDSSSWRTFQLSLEHPNGEQFLGTWPKQGTMRNGLLYEHQTWELPTKGNESSLLPTPVSNPPGGSPAQHLARKKNGKMQRENPTVTDLGMVVKLLPTPTARDHKGNNYKRDDTLTDVVKLVPRSIGGPTQTQSDAGNDSPGQLHNPRTKKADSAYNLWSG